jgi:hypothetical protein
LLKPLHCLKINRWLFNITLAAGASGGSPGNAAAQIEAFGIKPAGTESDTGKSARVVGCNRVVMTSASIVVGMWFLIAGSSGWFFNLVFIYYLCYRLFSKTKESLSCPKRSLICLIYPNFPLLSAAKYGIFSSFCVVNGKPLKKRIHLIYSPTCAAL